MAYQEELTSDTDIKKSYWWVTHLIQIKKRLTTLIITLLILWWLVIIGFVILIFVIQRDQDSTLRNNIRKQTTAYSVSVPPTEVVISDIGTLAGSGQSFDLYASLQNPNQEWWLDFTYQFFADGKPLEQRFSFIFPGEQKYLLFLAQTIPSNAKIDLKIASQKWYRITKKDKELLAQHHRFSVSDIQYTPADQTGSGFAVPISSVKFTMKNLSPFFFPELIVPIIAKEDSAIVAVAQIPLYSIRGEEERTRVVQWFHSFSQPTSFDIRPTVNVLKLIK